MSINEDNKQRVANLYTNYSNKLINYITTITNDTEEAEDIYQNMLLFLLENPNEKIWDKDTFNIAYVYRILYSRAINRINFKSKNNYTEINEDIFQCDEEEYDYDNDIDIENRLQMLIDTVNEAKANHIDKYINYYVKFYLYQMPIKILAKKAGVSNNTLYTHFRKIQMIIEEQVKEKAKSLIIND